MKTAGCPHQDCQHKWKAEWKLCGYRSRTDKQAKSKIRVTAGPAAPTTAATATTTTTTTTTTTAATTTTTRAQDSFARNGLFIP